MDNIKVNPKRNKDGTFIKGIIYSPSTQFKKGLPSLRKGVGKPGWTNQTSFKSRKQLWEENVREYQAIHRWVKKNLGEVIICEFCKKTNQSSYHWANKSQKYQKDVNDWIGLCAKCHKNYDLRFTSIKRAAEIMLKCHYENGIVIAEGNGGSLGSASHLSAELLGKFEKKRQPMASLSLSSNAVITAIANDFGFEYIFSRQIEGYGNKNSVLVCFTTSDYIEKTNHNINLWKSMYAAKKKKMKIIIFGSNKTQRLKSFANCFVKGEGKETSEIQQDHLALLHLVCREIEDKLWKTKYYVSSLA